MSNSVPIIRQVSLPALFFQFAFIGLIVFVLDYFKWKEPFLFGAIFYSLTAIVLRKIIASDHRRGVKLAKMKKFEEAIPYLEKSTDFFMKHPLIDRFRFITMLSSGAMTYREMSMVNMAFAYSQIGKGQKAMELYRQVLAVYPNNGLATSALKMLESVQA